MSSPSSIVYPLKATCTVGPNGKSCDGTEPEKPCTGVVTLEQPSADTITICWDLKNVGEPGSKHGFHVHEKADFSDGCYKGKWVWSQRSSSWLTSSSCSGSEKLQVKVKGNGVVSTKCVKKRKKAPAFGPLLSQYRVAPPPPQELMIMS